MVIRELLCKNNIMMTVSNKSLHTYRVLFYIYLLPFILLYDLKNPIFLGYYRDVSDKQSPDGKTHHTHTHPNPNCTSIYLERVQLSM